MEDCNSSTRLKTSWFPCRKFYEKSFSDVELLRLNIKDGLVCLSMVTLVKLKFDYRKYEGFTYMFDTETGNAFVHGEYIKGVRAVLFPTYKF
jgi:hypothetical protein